MMGIYIKRENFIFIFIFGALASLIAVLGYLSFINQFSQAYRQYKYLNSSNFVYVYKTDEKMAINSYLDFGNSKSFYIDQELTERIQISALMQLNVQYDESAFIKPSQMISVVSLELDQYEVFITLETANYYNLRLNDYIYSKSKTDQQVYSYKIAGIMSDIYSTNIYNYSSQKGILVFGYNYEEESNSDSFYVNFSLDDPSTVIVENNVGLLNLYNTSELKIHPLQITVVFICIQFLIALSISLLTYILLIKDSHSVFTRLKRAGAISTLNKMIFTRSAIFILYSLISIAVFTVILYLINPQYISDIMLLLTAVTIVAQVTLTSVWVKFSY